MQSFFTSGWKNALAHGTFAAILALSIRVIIDGFDERAVLFALSFGVIYGLILYVLGRVSRPPREQASKK